MIEKLNRLKATVAGNREKSRYEWTFGMPLEQTLGINAPSRSNRRLLSELAYAVHLSQALEHRYDGEIEAAVDFLLQRMQEQSALTNADCAQAEVMLSSLQDDAKSYTLLLAAHAHIDMNWMWGYEETVSAVLSTFRSILNIMREYPQFCFSQSQASVYRIVEEYDPDMMREIRQRISEGRWEVTASAWVETDKNMPSGESLLRHAEQTKKYLSAVWGVQDFSVDFSPDTFGHSANIAEIDAQAGIQYLYHCRGLGEDVLLYRFRAPSGKELLAYREPFWYNSGITPEIGTSMFEVLKRSCGLKTALIVYGVGNHGGGPTRRDIESALEMQSWPIFPTIRFGTFRAYFREAERVRQSLPVIDRELNCIFPGCYTTQSRIKRGNCRSEASLIQAESAAALASLAVGRPARPACMDAAWRGVLFTHFHDILTGSCVQDSREYAMALYQRACAAANTQLQQALSAVCAQIDTSRFPAGPDDALFSEGAGAGYGTDGFIGVPATERGRGATRVYSVFNLLPWQRRQEVVLTLWDWTGDLHRLYAADESGRTKELQLLDTQQQKYWEHQYVRVLVTVDVPAFGYTTVMLGQKPADTLPAYLNTVPYDRENQPFCNPEAENEFLRVRLSVQTGRIVSLYDKRAGKELIADGESAGLTLLQTESGSSNAWVIGRRLTQMHAERCMELKQVTDGPLQWSVRAVYQLGASHAELCYVLEKSCPQLRVEVKIDWHEIAGDTIPALEYRMPLAQTAEVYRCGVPMGSLLRPAAEHDVPCQRYMAACTPDGYAPAILCDCKYGYHARPGEIGVTLLHSSNAPDPYPERGIHTLRLWLGTLDASVAAAERSAASLLYPMACQPVNRHAGVLPAENSLLRLESNQAVVTAIRPLEDGSVQVRGYEASGSAGIAAIVRNEAAVRIPLAPNAIFQAVLPAERP